MLSSNTKRAFEIYLDAISGVTTEDAFAKVTSEYIARAKKKRVDFDKMILEIAQFLKQCGDNGGNKSWGDMDEFNKKGFSVLMKFGPAEFVNTVKSGGKTVLEQFTQERVAAALAVAGIEVVNGKIRKSQAKEALKVIADLDKPKVGDLIQAFHTEFEDRGYVIGKVTAIREDSQKQVSYVEYDALFDIRADYKVRDMKGEPMRIIENGVPSTSGKETNFIRIIK